ncbi:MAG: hypothetical protein WCO09_00575 [bacterium]
MNPEINKENGENVVMPNNETLDKATTPSSIVPHGNTINSTPIPSTSIPIQNTSIHTSIPKKSDGSILILVVIILLILLVGATAFAYVKKMGPFNDAQNNQVNNIGAASSTNSNPVTDNSATTSITVAVDPASSTTTSTNAIKSDSSAGDQTEKVDLWGIFDKSVLAVKNKDIKSYNKYSYTQVTPDQESQFLQYASFLLDITKKINKSDYVNKWQDGKQAIFTTLPQKTDDDSQYGYKQGMIMFINKDGLWKILSISPDRAWAISKSGTNHTATQIEQELQAMMLDSDKDGLTNEEELCLGAKKGDPTCVKTNPNKRDTNGDGWWDGIRVSMGQ